LLSSPPKFIYCPIAMMEVRVTTPHMFTSYQHAKWCTQGNNERVGKMISSLTVGEYPPLTLYEARATSSGHDTLHCGRSREIWLSVGAGISPFEVVFSKFWSSSLFGGAEVDTRCRNLPSALVESITPYPGTPSIFCWFYYCLWVHCFQVVLSGFYLNSSY